jgi:hypothetical protein
VTYIGGYVFEECDALTTIYVTEGSYAASFDGFPVGITPTVLPRVEPPPSPELTPEEPQPEPQPEPTPTPTEPEEPAPTWNNIAPPTLPTFTRNPAPVYTVLNLTSDGEAVGTLKFREHDYYTDDFNTELFFETGRIYTVQNYIKKRWNPGILGAFETAQKGGWVVGEDLRFTVTLSVSLDKLGFEADDGTELFALIYDTKAKKWYQADAEIIDGDVVIKTKRTGIVAIVTKSVK